MGRWVSITAVKTQRYIFASLSPSCAALGFILTCALQVTIEINTNLPKKEPKEPKTEGTDKDKKEEGPSEAKQSFEFKIPAELLQ